MQDNGSFEPTGEEMFLSPPGTTSFGRPGDSGSVGYDIKDRGVGLLFSGTTSQTQETFVNVMPLEHIFANIREFLKDNKVTGIRMALLSREAGTRARR